MDGADIESRSQGMSEAWSLEGLDIRLDIKVMSKESYVLGM